MANQATGLTHAVAQFRIDESAAVELPALRETPAHTPTPPPRPRPALASDKKKAAAAPRLTPVSAGDDEDWKEF
jgi:hypothetical protein